RAFQQEAPDEVGAGEVLVARDRDERALELERHVLEEPRLAAAGRALEHDREAPARGGLEYRDLVALRLVVRRDVVRLGCLDDVVLDAAQAVYCCLHSNSGSDGVRRPSWPQPGGRRALRRTDHRAGTGKILQRCRLRYCRTACMPGKPARRPFGWRAALL